MVSYAVLSKGKSLPVSLGLIGFEVSILPLAIYYDVLNSFWRKRGLAVLDEDFIDMEYTPVFKVKATDIPTGEFNSIPVAKYRSRISNLLKKEEWEEANKEFILIRAELEKRELIYPLLNHFLESAHRCVALTVIWAQKCKGSTTLLKHFYQYRRWLVWWQMVGLEGALILDYISWPLRKNGLLILTQDVPAIPVPKLNDNGEIN